MKDLEIDAVDDFLEVLRALNERISKLEGEIEEIVGDMEETRVLMTIPGVSYFTALLIISERGDIERFPDSEKLRAYFGLVPKVYQSEETVKLGNITTECRSLVRWVLVQAILTHGKSDSKLTRYYKKIKKKKVRESQLLQQPER